MITKAIWKNLFYAETPLFGYKYTTNLNTMMCLILSIFTIPLDIILLPLEIITFIINIFL